MYFSPHTDDGVKNSSLEKQQLETPHSGKNYSFRKAHESQRSGFKKTALEKYVSESLENLELGRKKVDSSSNKQSDIKNTLKKQPLEEGSAKPKLLSREKQQLNNESTPKQPLPDKNSARKEDKDESL
jgi:hypothetical protein